MSVHIGSVNYYPIFLAVSPSKWIRHHQFSLSLVNYYITKAIEILELEAKNIVADLFCYQGLAVSMPPWALSSVERERERHFIFYF